MDLKMVGVASTTAISRTPRATVCVSAAADNNNNADDERDVDRLRTALARSETTVELMLRELAAAREAVHSAARTRATATATPSTSTATSASQEAEDVTSLLMRRWGVKPSSALVKRERVTAEETSFAATNAAILALREATERERQALMREARAEHFVREARESAAEAVCRAEQADATAATDRAARCALELALAESREVARTTTERCVQMLALAVSTDTTIQHRQLLTLSVPGAHTSSLPVHLQVDNDVAELQLNAARCDVTTALTALLGDTNE